MKAETLLLHNYIHIHFKQLKLGLYSMLVYYNSVEKYYENYLNYMKNKIPVEYKNFYANKYSIYVSASLKTINKTKVPSQDIPILTEEQFYQMCAIKLILSRLFTFPDEILLYKQNLEHFIVRYIEAYEAFIKLYQYFIQIFLYSNDKDYQNLLANFHSKQMINNQTNEKEVIETFLLSNLLSLSSYDDDNNADDKYG